MKKKGSMMPKPRVMQLSPAAVAELDTAAEWAMQSKANSRWSEDVMATILYLRDEKRLAFSSITAILNRKFPTYKWLSNTVQIKYRQHTFIEGN